VPQVTAMFDTDVAAQDERRAVQKYFGKYPGLVLDNAPETGGAHRGEIEVEVPGLLEEDPSGSGERAMRVVAKPCFLPGFFFVPEAGQQVWIEFVAGDIDWPIWSGVWYPTDAAPQTVDGEAPTAAQKVIRTASGQVIQLDDSGGSEGLVIRDEENNSRIVMDSDGIRLESGECSIQLGGTTITVTNGVHTLEMTPAGTKVTDGSTGGPHFIVLAPVLKWLTKHQHVGNMGAPTPVFPDDLLEILPYDQLGTGKSGL
jgi:hypothetical protein